MIGEENKVIKDTLYKSVSKLRRHDYIIDELSRSLLKMGYDNESIIISQKITIKDYERSEVETTIDILPVYRIKTTKKDIADIVEDPNIMIEEDWRGGR